MPARDVLPMPERRLARPAKAQGNSIVSHPRLIEQFRLEADGEARRWLDSHPTTRSRVIAYDVHRCCGGGKICQVRVREESSRDDPDGYASGTLDDGTRILIDRRAAARLPSRFQLTMRGLGPLRHLDLDLDGDQWAALLYD
jgi:hypothetical protein